MLEELIKSKKTEQDVNLMSPLTWAYIGDAVYELYIRTDLVNRTSYKPNKLHIETIKFVKAKAQAELLYKIQDNLTIEEKDIVRRGRNTKTNHIAKNSNVQEYMNATAFEALIGYLYLCNKMARIREILDINNKITNIGNKL